MDTITVNWILVFITSLLLLAFTHSHTEFQPLIRRNDQVMSLEPNLQPSRLLSWS